MATLMATGVAALLLGVLTAYAQGWLPDQLRSLANSAGAWALVAFLLALLPTRAVVAAVSGVLSLVALLFGYVVGAAAQDAPYSSSLIGFWGLAAVVAGPALGVAAHWARSKREFLPGIGIGVLGGVLIGEGSYGLTYIADTTYGPYWLCEAAVGSAVVLAAAARRPRDLRTVGGAVVTASVVAVAFVAIYSQDLIRVL